jgi:hypothetical protein
LISLYLLFAKRRIQLILNVRQNNLGFLSYIVNMDRLVKLTESSFIAAVGTNVSSMKNVETVQNKIEVVINQSASSSI